MSSRTVYVGPRPPNAPDVHVGVLCAVQCPHEGCRAWARHLTAPCGCFTCSRCGGHISRDHIKFVSAPTLELVLDDLFGRRRN